MGTVKIVFIGKKNSGKETFRKCLEDTRTYFGFFDRTEVHTEGSAITITEYDIPFDFTSFDLVVLNEIILDERDTAKILEDVSLLLQAGVVRLSATARQLGLYTTGLAFDERVIYVCDTGNQELDQKLKELLEQYYHEYSRSPYAIFAYDDVADSAEETLRTIPRAKKAVEAKYKIDRIYIAKGIERAGYLMLTKNILFGALLLAAVDLVVANMPKT
ncbi:hypothetical protein IKH83_00580 [Candidatus Saccharibacteria bacterium]|nr:hypothetical protein [Candidatus Saccharibacteria bacterium]